MFPVAASELLAAAHEPDITTHPLVTGLARARLPKSALRLYVQGLSGLAAGFPVVLARLFDRCDNDVIREVLIENLMEEVGAVSYSLDSGIRLEKSRSHEQLCKQMMQAVGLEPRLVAARTSRWFDASLEKGDWVGAVAYACVAIEHNTARTFRMMIRGLRDGYGLTEDGAAFFVEHCIADERHGERSAGILAACLTTDEGRLAALNGARHGARAWWAFHSAVHAQWEKSSGASRAN